MARVLKILVTKFLLDFQRHKIFFVVEKVRLIESLRD